jgi:hypothetical protein
MRGRIPLTVALLLIAGAGPLFSQNRVPASVWRQAVGQQRLRLDDGDSDSDGNRNRAVYYDDRYYGYDDGYYSDADSDSDSDSDGGRAQRVERFPSRRYPYPSDYPSDRDGRTQGGVGGILRDVILGRTEGGAAGRARGGVGGAIERARNPGQVRRDRLPTANRPQRGGVGGVLGDVVRSRAGESASATLGRWINGLLEGGR